MTHAFCNLCGEPMPNGEEMFNHHGYSGPCPKPPLDRPTLEKLLRMTVPVPAGVMAPEGSAMSPEFRVSIQKVADDGVHFIIHAEGHDSDTMDFKVRGNHLARIESE